MHKRAARLLADEARRTARLEDHRGVRKRSDHVPAEKGSHAATDAADEQEEEPRDQGIPSSRTDGYRPVEECSRVCMSIVPLNREGGMRALYTVQHSFLGYQIN